MTTYEIGSSSGNYQPQSPNNNQRNSFNYNFGDNSKDQKISQLKAKLNDLKEHQKDYDSLNQRYKQLLNDFSVLNEAKLRLEYEILQLGLNDKMTDSKKLHSENDILGREIGLKDGEINDLNSRLSDLSYQLDRTQEKRDELSRMLRNLNDNNVNQNEQICKLKQDNICLAKICQENEKNLKFGENEINKLSHTIDDNNYELQNLNRKVIQHENNLNDLQRKLDCYNELNSKMQNNIKNYENEFDNLRNENDGLKNNLLNERTLRTEKENQNEKLRNILMDKERILNQLCNDNEKIQNDKLRQQVRNLECQNQNIIHEIDNILDEDRKMKEILSRKSRITSLLRDNNDTLERSVNNLDKYVNCTSYDNYSYDRPSSQRLTYQFQERSYI